MGTHITCTVGDMSAHEKDTNNLREYIDVFSQIICIFAVICQIYKWNSESIHTIVRVFSWTKQTTYATHSHPYCGARKL